MLELTFDFPSGTFNLSFSKMNSPCLPKAKAKEKQRKRKIKVNKVKSRKKKKKKAFICAPVFEKSTLCDLLKTYLSIPLFTN